jgi:hypothetical protein
MNEGPIQQWETRLRQAGRHLPYPATPDLTGAVREQLVRDVARPAVYRRRLAWAALIVLALLVGLMAVPQVRARVLEVLRLGGVEIILEPTPAATLRPGTRTPAAPTQPPLASVLDLSGETTLDEAQTELSFPIRLPTHPADLGPPDRVFLQDLGGPAAVLVWLDDEHPGRVRLSLQQLGPGALVWKLEPEAIEETTVNGERALWAEGPYLLKTQRGDLEQRRLVQGHVLVWNEGEITYRLETDLPLEEGVRIAESLR